MKAFQDIQEYSELITNVKEKEVVRKLKSKVEIMLGYQTDKMLFEKKVVFNASNKQR